MEAILDLNVLQIAASIRCNKDVVMWVSCSLPDPPTVTLSIEPRSVLEGDRVTFTCQAHANPPIMGYRSAFSFSLKSSYQAVSLYLFNICNIMHFDPRWAKGGVVLQGARESVFTTKADHSFFTEPVSCLVFNAVGKTNVSILVDVHCESHNTHLTLLSHSWPSSLTTLWSQREETHHCCVSFSSEQLLPLSPAALLLKHYKEHPSLFLCLQSVRFCWWSRSQKQ